MRVGRRRVPRMLRLRLELNQGGCRLPAFNSSPHPVVFAGTPPYWARALFNMYALPKSPFLPPRTGPAPINVGESREPVQSRTEPIDPSASAAQNTVFCQHPHAQAG